MSTLQFETRPIASLKPAPRNARTHSPEQIAQIAASIREFGWTNPVLVDEHGEIVAGHGRTAAAKSLGLGEVPVLVLSGLSEAQKRALAIADNKLALNAGWDEETLRAELGDLRDLGYQLEVIGFDRDELADLLSIGVSGGLTDPDAAPAPPGVPVSVPGDLWVIGNHRVLCADSTRPESVRLVMDGALADAAWTDPPYNVAYESGAGKIANDDMSAEKFAEFLHAAFRGFAIALKPGGAIYVAHADTEGLAFRSAFAGAGFKLSGCLVWRKDSLVLGRSDYQWIHEPILYGWKPGRAHRWFGGRKQTTVADLGEESPFERLDDGRWRITIGDRALIVGADATVQDVHTSVIFEPKPRRSADHPTMKPTALIERMLRNSAKPGDVIVDLFGGSGSTMIAAERLGMSARLVELEPRFVDVIVRRWQEYTGRDAVHAEGATFEEVRAQRLGGAD